MPFFLATSRVTLTLRSNFKRTIGVLPYSACQSSSGGYVFASVRAQPLLQNRRTFHSTLRAEDGKSDPYGTLGVKDNASSSEIKKAYYKLAKQYHPDVNKDEGSEKRFHDIQDAYEILSNPQKKEQFDTFGASSFHGAGGAGEQSGDGAYNPFSNFSGFGGGGHPFDFEDIFGAAFSGNARTRGRRKDTVEEYRGEDIEVLMQIELLDAAKGKTVDVNYNPLVACNTCSGNGLKPGHKRSTCPRCRGTGTQTQNTQAGFTIAMTCMSCGGSGVVITPDSQCNTCDGNGLVKSKKTTTVDIPPGIEDGMRLRVVGEGDAPAILTSKNVRVHRGDLYVRVRVKTHPKFVRKGSNLHYTLEIPVTTAALGGRVRIPTLDGEADLNVPTATQNGMTVTVNGKGLPVLNRKENGDLKVLFKVNVMRPTTARQTELLEQLADAFNDQTARRSEKK
ncbi:hypothetical protein V1514DRAFT_326635 [Lipomyces japonicus]|uniref:uncharacterized protein n=1 Tax=Lipomyces japonicus TaxID=56871 RepID=UPI0034CFACAA